MKKEIIAVKDAAGKILCHDITAMVPGVYKGPRFKKGYIIREKDIEELQLLGKDHILIIELDSDDIHEDDAGTRLGLGAAGPGIRLVGPFESRVNLISAYPGLLKVNIELLEQLNALSDVIMATLPTNTVVDEGEKVAGAKVIPLTVKKKLIDQAEEIMRKGSVVQIKPFIEKSVSLIVTGGEIYSGKVKDSFGPVLAEKISRYNSAVVSVDIVPDHAGEIAKRISQKADSGAGLIIVTGGMAVDPDDVTPLGISLSGAEIIRYGAPVFPGAMFMLGYIGDTAVMGVPACGMYYRVSILDLVLPRIMAGERITGRDIIGFAHGGLCRSCDNCLFPRCSFGVPGFCQPF